MGFDNQNPASRRRRARYLPTEASIGVGSRCKLIDEASSRLKNIAAPLMPNSDANWKTRSGWLPIAIPVFLLLLGLRYVAIHGLLRQADEGTEAHLFQLLMPVQLAVMAYFALTWLPRSPRGTLPVLALQAIAAAAVFAAVYWIEHTGPTV